jgi:phage gpG-like protein
MMEIESKVVGVESFKHRLELAEKDVRVRLRQTVRELATLLIRHVKTQKLEGQVLHVQTGRLRRSINATFGETEASIFASVGTNVSYGRVWELGFQGDVIVRAHVRRNSGRNQYGSTQGRDILSRRKANKGEVIGSRLNKVLTASGVSYVKQYVRHVNLAPRPFLRPSLEEMRQTIRMKLMHAVDGAI